MTDSSRTTSAGASTTAAERSPWPALWALVIGFFMILVDTTIVGVANPAIKAALDPDSNNLDRVVWVTSAYLLAYAVPLLITGRLGDRFGPKNLYLIGLAIFTLSSLWCGLSTTLDGLIWARAAQGLGAALLTPQTMAVITRTFPPERRGAAMGLWGGASGVAMLVGPLAGGFLVDGLGWEWIFFINLPVGVVGFVLACILVPKLQTHPHRFDVPGVFLSAAAMFLIVFGLQEAEAHDWGVIWGPISVWSLIIVGVVVLVLFLWYQTRTKNEPLVPMELFRNRNFAWSVTTIAVVGFTVTAQGLPLMFFLQLARGLTPTESALLLIPMALAAGIVSPFAGQLLDRIDPRLMLVPGLLLVSLSLFLFAAMMNTDIAIGWLLVPSAILGFGNAGMWGPLATTATRDLPMHQAGAGSGIYNAMRTVGSVLGSAAIAAFMQSRLVANLPGAEDAAAGFGEGRMPDAVAAPFADAMAQTMLMPAAAILLGVAAVLFLRRPKHLGVRNK